MNPLKLNSYAKVNLSLYIFNKQKNNFHKIESIMHQIGLYDTIKIKKLKQNKIIIKSNIKKIQNKNNLCYKVASLLKNKFKIKQGVEIDINKKIPLQAGLGGGSSNAASTLIALDKLFNLKLNKNELNNLASKIGSDVPFFIEGKTCIVEGIGNRIKKINSDLKLNFLIIKPKINISTKFAYNEYDKHIKNKTLKFSSKIIKYNKNKKIIKALEQKNTEKIAENLHNDFESIIIKKYSIIKKIKNGLMENNALNAIISGSGSAVFGIFKNKKDAVNAHNKLRKKYYFAALAKSF